VTARRVPHTVIATVVLPDHVHAVIWMEDDTANYPRLWQDIKKEFTRRDACTRRLRPYQSDEA
jgi:putative transposase